MPRQKLSTEEAMRRLKYRSVRYNMISKQKRDRDREMGIPAKKKILTEQQKLSNKIRVKEWRDKKRLLSPPRQVMTPEERRKAKALSARKQYLKKLAKQGKKITIVRMEKILKSRPANRISEKVIKPVKIDTAKQPVCNIKADDSGKVKTQLDSKTWVMAYPDADVNALRRKYLKV